MFHRFFTIMVVGEEVKLAGEPTISQGKAGFDLVPLHKPHPLFYEKLKASAPGRPALREFGLCFFGAISA